MNSNKHRETLTTWWQSLSIEQKKLVPVARNRVDLRSLFDDVDTGGYYGIRKTLKDDINNIETELKALGVLYNDDVDVVSNLMRDFISMCESTPDLLWDIKFSAALGSKFKDENGKDEYLEQIGFVSTAYLANKLSCQPKILYKTELLDLRKKLNQLLLTHEVSLPYCEIKDSSHSVGSDLELRRIFLKWKKSLAEQDKLNLPIFGDSLDKKAFSHVISPERSKILLPLTSMEYRRFSSELIKLKGIVYKTVKEREDERRYKVLDRDESERSVFLALRDKKLTTIDDLGSDINDYLHVQHVFAAAALNATSESGILNYHHSYKYYVNFLTNKGISGNSSIEECFNLWSLREFKEYLGNKIGDADLSSSTANTLLSALRMTLEKLKTIRGFDFNYYPADGFEIVRESLAYKPYSPRERKQIHEMLEEELAIARRKLEPYQRLDRESANLADPKVQARIIFEDDCDCIPTYSGNWAAKERNEGQNKLVAFTGKRNLSLHSLFDEWGVLTRRITDSEIGVYVLKMAQVLGMNLSPILDLESDDYQEHHPLTNKPCLTYWKERSTGEKMIHLDLFHADLQWLTTSQNHFVAGVFSEVTKLTSEARKYADSELTQRLFITFEKKTKVLNEYHMSNYYAMLVDKYNLKSDDGEPLVLTTTRFRPTLVSELIDKSVSIREIQYLLGHSSLYTTMKYLDQLEFDRVIRDKARKAIENIYNNAVQPKTENHKIHRKYDEAQVIMKTPLGGCKNIFDPPDFIKNSSLYVKGKPCSQYNKCLGCENVMLTERHLPDLFAMQRDYLATIERAEVINTPYYVVVLENQSLLDDILNPETSEFDEEILKQAKEDSLFIETNILESWGS
ncbi:site-specific integrase [Vibrio metschnikovii]|nr:site-specific integrase [Vibrio metschnikovii]EKO3696183.1 site-specific integrase [Vibrio metschnikovii]EKO3732509.1 site-specific integrase [Vibrio metschnikovii]